MLAPLGIEHSIVQAPMAGGATAPAAALAVSDAGARERSAAAPVRRSVAGLADVA
jgi:NAD(P)H-dependent flavin oxidoreductase YrpB (nitropropane dioxygenase family)